MENALRSQQVYLTAGFIQMIKTVMDVLKAIILNKTNVIQLKDQLKTAFTIIKINHVVNVIIHLF